MAPKIIFHIGLEKTGSTSFQEYCRRNRSELLSGGILYPDDRRCFFGANHAPLAASYFSPEDAERLLIRPWRADRDTAVGAVRREITAAAPDTVLISAEHFSSRFSPDRIRWLADDFAWADCRIAAVARDHFARALSAYSTTIASGRDITLDAYIDELCLRDNSYLRHEESIAPWEQAFGRDRVQIIGYREGGDIVERLAFALIPAGWRGGGRATYRLNASPGAAATEALRRINGEFARARQTGRARTQAAIESMRKMMRKAALPASGGKWRLTPDQWRRLDAVAAPDRIWLESRGVSLAPSVPPPSV